MSQTTQTHNTRELVLNYRVNLERWANWLATKPRHMKMDSRQEWHRNRRAASFTSDELALKYRVNQERSCKEEKGLATLDYWQANSVCNLTRYNNKWKEDESGREIGEQVKCHHIQQKVITVIVTKSGWRNRRGQAAQVSKGRLKCEREGKKKSG